MLRDGVPTHQDLGPSPSRVRPLLPLRPSFLQRSTRPERAVSIRLIPIDDLRL